MILNQCQKKRRSRIFLSETQIKLNGIILLSPHLAHLNRLTYRFLLRKADKLRIPWNPIFPNTFLLKPLLHPHPPRLIKSNPSSLHNPQYLPLARLIEARTFIAANNIVRDVEGGRVQAGFNVALETSRERRIAVEIEGWERRERKSGDALAGLREPA